MNPTPTGLSFGARSLASGGAIGVAGFVAAWASLGVLRDEYSPVSQAISQLGAAQAPNRVWMNAGFICFGIGLIAFGVALRGALGGYAWLSATATGLSAFGVAATPLGRYDTAHYVAATIGYVTLVLVPALASRQFRTMGWKRWALVSEVCACASACLLVLSIADPAHGLTQRIGLLCTDLWIVAVSLRLSVRGHLSPRQNSHRRD